MYDFLLIVCCGAICTQKKNPPKQKQKGYPEVYAAIETRHAATFVLTHDIQEVKKLFKFGIIDGKNWMFMGAKKKKFL